MYFLDCGGNVSEKQVYEAFKILTSDPQVNKIEETFFNNLIF